MIVGHKAPKTSKFKKIFIFGNKVFRCIFSHFRIRTYVQYFKPTQFVASEGLFLYRYILLPQNLNLENHLRISKNVQSKLYFKVPNIVCHLDRWKSTGPNVRVEDTVVPVDMHGRQNRIELEFILISGNKAENLL